MSFHLCSAVLSLLLLVISSPLSLHCAAQDFQHSGQMRHMSVSVPPYDIYSIELKPGEPPLFVPQQPLDLKLLQYHLIEGGFVCVFPTGKPGRTLVIDAYRNGEPGKMPVFVRLTVKVGDGDPPDPPDPPGPDPPGPKPPGPLSDWAQFSLDSVPLILDRSRALVPQVAENFQATSAAIAAGIIKTKPNAISDLHARNQAVWGQYGEGDWWGWLKKIGDEVDRAEDAGKLDDIKTYGILLREIGKGLAAWN